MSTPFNNYNLISIAEFIKVYKLDDGSSIVSPKTGKGKTRPNAKQSGGGHNHGNRK